MHQTPQLKRTIINNLVALREGLPAVVTFGLFLALAFFVEGGR